MELRPYQQVAREAVEGQWQSGIDRTLLVLPTGCGKTIVFVKVIEDCVRKGERVLILAHRGELLDQAADKLQKGCRAEVRGRKGRAELYRQLVPRSCWLCTDPYAGKAAESICVRLL